MPLHAASSVFRLLTLTLLLTAFLTPIAAQEQEPLDLIYQGEFDELGWDYGGLSHVVVTITALAKTGCQIDNAHAGDMDIPGYFSAINQLLREYEPDLPLLIAVGYAGHPTAQRLPFWLTEQGMSSNDQPLDCAHPVIQRLMLNTVRYVIDYRSNQPTPAEMVEAQRDAWWADLAMVRAAEEIAFWHLAGWVRHRVGVDLKLENRDEVIRSLAENLEALDPDLLERCEWVAMRVLVDRHGRVVDVFERSEASGYSSYNVDEDARAIHANYKERCGAAYPTIKDAIRSMKLRPARTPEGLDVPIWVLMGVEWRQNGLRLNTSSWAWRLREGEILPEKPPSLQPHLFKSGSPPPPAVDDVGVEEREDAAAILEKLKASGPTFTPATHKPELANADAVQEALQRYYPAELRDQGVGGNVQLWLLIDTRGAVADTRVANGSEHPGFDAAAQEVAEVMEFRPARNMREITPVWLQITVTFEP